MPSSKGARMEIRDAGPVDAAPVCAVLRRSITELCVADHRNDPAILERWLANKTPEIVASWIGQPASSMLVAVEAVLLFGIGLFLAGLTVHFRDVKDLLATLLTLWFFATPVAYSAATLPARAPNTRISGSEFEPSRLAPLILTQAHSPAANKPRSGVAPSMSVEMPPIM